MGETISSKELFVSVITYIELMNGAKKSNSQQEEQKVANFLMDFNISIINLDLSIADIFVADRVLLESRGKRIDNFDLFIAATAKVHDLPLFTYNKKHFNRIPDLKLV